MRKNILTLPSLHIPPQKSLPKRPTFYHCGLPQFTLHHCKPKHYPRNFYLYLHQLYILYIYIYIDINIYIYMSVSISISIYLSIYLSVCLSVCLSIYLTITKRSQKAVSKKKFEEVA